MTYKNSSSANVPEYKIVILGSGGVGKSALVFRLLTDNFVEDYDPTIQDSYRKVISVDDESCMVEMLDTAGQQEFRCMLEEWMRNGQAFLLVYSIIERQTFDDVLQLREKILLSKDEENFPIVLVGNKCDLDSHRVITYEEGVNAAKEWGKYCVFFETSAKEKINHEECFHEAIRLIQKYQDQEPKDVIQLPETQCCSCYIL